MISPAMLGTADDGKRLVLYPLELSLRDMFAMAALAGIRSAEGFSPDCPEVAKYAYLQADAMLAERAK